MRAAVRAICNGCGRVVLAGAFAIFDFRIARTGTWVALRHPECRNKRAILDFSPLEAIV